MVISMVSMLFLLVFSLIWWLIYNRSIGQVKEKTISAVIIMESERKRKPYYRRNYF